MSESGGNDLYTYWYAGLHIRQGQDPYRAFLEDTHPVMPISFLDGTAHELEQVVRPALQPAPGLTFPLIYLLTPLAWFTFKTAKLIWFILLILLNMSIPVLMLWAMRTKPPGFRLEFIILLAVFMGFSSTRYATISGQPSIPVIALMLLTWIWAEKRPWLAGTLLGLALSKYSLALGFWVYFTLFERRWKLSLAAITVQVAGVFGLAWLGGVPPIQVLDGYLQLFLHHAPMEGIQLTSLLPGVGAFSPSLAIALTVGIGIPLAILARRLKHSAIDLESEPALRATLLTTLTCWSLLVAYHRAYDLQVLILIPGLVLLFRLPGGNVIPGKLGLRSWELYAGLSILLLSLPAGSLMRGWLPPELGVMWTRTILRGSTWVVLLGMILSVRYLFHLTRGQAVLKEA